MNPLIVFAPVAVGVGLLIASKSKGKQSPEVKAAEGEAQSAEQAADQAEDKADRLEEQAEQDPSKRTEAAEARAEATEARREAQRAQARAGEVKKEQKQRAGSSTTKAEDDLQAEIARVLSSGDPAALAALAARLDALGWDDAADQLRREAARLGAPQERKKGSMPKDETKPPKEQKGRAMPPELPRFEPGSRTLRLKTPNMRGTDVMFVQSKTGAKEDGIFGPKTAESVRSYQRQNGLVADSIVGPKTWAVLLGKVPAKAPQAPAKQPAAKPVAKPAAGGGAAAQGSQPFEPGSRTLRLRSPYMRGSDVAFVQSKTGAKEDGIFGPKTAESVRGYQRQNGLVADSIVGPKTWAVLLGKVPAGELPAGSAPSIPEDPLRQAAKDVIAYLRSLGGLDARGTEDQTVIKEYQKKEGLTADGKYGPGTAGRILGYGLVPVVPFYWSRDATNASKQKILFLQQVEKQKQLNPSLGAQFDALRADVNRS